MLQVHQILFNPVKGLLIIALFVIVSSLGACGIMSSDGNPSLHIETEEEVYDLDKYEYISVEIENTSDRTIYYSTCLAKELEILDGGVLIDTVPFGVCDCICAATLEPGESVDPNITNVSISLLKSKTEHLISKEGISYRLKYAFYEDKAWGDKLLPVNELRSNAFYLTYTE